MTRLDNFFTELLIHQKPRYQALWKVFLMIFTLSHGQAAVERGFSVNKDVEIVNLKKEVLVAQRLVHNALITHGVKNVSTFHISREPKSPGTAGQEVQTELSPSSTG
jgi:hypothetical protein